VIPDGHDEAWSYQEHRHALQRVRFNN
jgi:hypothetical protein